MKLTFENNYFVIRSIEAAKLSTLTSYLTSSRWVQNHADNSFRTNKLIEAARFRKFADARTEKIFSKLMLKTMPFPTGGSFTPPYLELMDFQKEKGVPHILKNSKSYLAHQPGLGKTPQAIAAVNMKPGRVLVICPAFLVVNWIREITKWSVKDFPEIQVVNAVDPIDYVPDWYICSDALLQNPLVIEKLAKMKFTFVFVDEAHRFKTPGAVRTTALFGGSTRTEDARKRGKEIFKSPGLVYNAEHVCLLSGTPMLGKAIDLWPMLYALAPETIDFMSYENFGFKYCGAIQGERGEWIFSGSANESELHMRIMGRFMQRIRKADVLKDLPDKVREVILMSADPRSKDLKKIDFELMQEFNIEELDKPDSLGKYAEARHEIGLLKVPWVANFVHQYLFEDSTEQIILFAHHKDVVAKLANALLHFHPNIINGDVPNSERTRIEDLFQKGKSRLIVGNISAMNLGITLTAATRVIFAEYDWTPANNEQAEDRAHRIGQRDCVYVQYLVLPDSIDELQLNAVLKKQESIKKVIDAK